MASGNGACSPSSPNFNEGRLYVWHVYSGCLPNLITRRVWLHHVFEAQIVPALYASCAPLSTQSADLTRANKMVPQQHPPIILIRSLGVCKVFPVSLPPSLCLSLSVSPCFPLSLCFSLPLIVVQLRRATRTNRLLKQASTIHLFPHFPIASPRGNNSRTAWCVAQ